MAPQWAGLDTRQASLRVTPGSFGERIFPGGVGDVSFIIQLYISIYSKNQIITVGASGHFLCFIERFSSLWSLKCASIIEKGCPL